MIEPMRAGLRSPRGTVLLAVVALVAEWWGHALTWWWTGGADPGRALSGSMHAYLQPLGITLGVAAVASAWMVVHTLGSLADQAGHLRQRLAAGGRGVPAVGTVAVDGAVGGAPDGSGPSAGRRARSAPTSPPNRPPTSLWPARVARLAAGLLAIQLVVYFVQENLEVRAAGLPWPGLRVLTAHHGSALVVHTGVALVAALVVVAVSTRLAAGDARVARLVALLHVLVARRQRAAGWPRSRPTGVIRRPLRADALGPRAPPIALPS